VDFNAARFSRIPLGWVLYHGFDVQVQNDAGCSLLEVIEEDLFCRRSFQVKGIAAPWIGGP